jgi:hypothetical protein
VYEFHHSRDNKKLHEPINWLWANANGDFLCKVDDDCLMPYGWASVLRQAHADVPEFGAIGCWRFPEEDFVPELAHRKIKTFPGGHQIMQNCWVEGSGFLMKQACIEEHGLLLPGESFTCYCIRLALAGWINGWYYPFLYQEHMDHPRAPHTMLKTEDEFQCYMPLTAKYFNIPSLEQWNQYLRNDAIYIQTASINPKDYIGWRAKFRRLVNKIIRKIRPSQTRYTPLLTGIKKGKR